jgi:hypothetical protein
LPSLRLPLFIFYVIFCPFRFSLPFRLPLPPSPSLHYTDLPPRISGDKLWYRDNPAARGKSKKLLPEKFRNMFDAKAVVCVEYQDLDDADEREIFQVGGRCLCFVWTGGDDPDVDVRDSRA